ncbi:recombinase family protein [Neomicrococcus lactis]|uniref:DNA invertase Pin-like site-specific DNA recombinase n=1 Tax=Neomicrococcus lactis TaxID=732241 RepID=A0A7W9DAN4_9MICC|nr:DNA invertase Pin-like site-specific DNA recombinase [Neomicrococcus lactis]
MSEIRAGNQRRQTMQHRYYRHMLIGYARVSTADQNPDHQTDALARAGVDPANIYLDHASGAKASRPELDKALASANRAGDQLVITRLDRLGRSVLHLVTLGAALRERGVGLRVLEQGIDTTTAEGRAMFGMLSVLAELQRELIVANTRDGLAAARARGRTGGRRPKLTPDQAHHAQQLYDAGTHTVQRIADLLQVPRSTIYGHLDKASIGRRPTAKATLEA